MDYVTVYSVDPNVSAEGEERVNINEQGSQDLAELLKETVSEDRYFDLMDYVRSGRPFESVLDFYYKVGLTIEEFEPIADRLTTRDEEEVMGLVNVATASREVLLCLPELDESDVDALIERRLESATDTSTIAWVADVLPPEKGAPVGAHITSRSFQYSADIVSVSGDGRAFKRYRAVIDAGGDSPRLVYWRDLSYLGWPLDLEIIDTLRAGNELDELTVSS
jgi:hypothetical protein